MNNDVLEILKHVISVHFGKKFALKNFYNIDF